jgi:hypothetical protein
MCFHENTKKWDDPIMIQAAQFDGLMTEAL